MTDRTVIQDATRYHVGTLDFTGAVTPLCQAWVSTRRCIVRRESVAAFEAYLCSACARRMIGVR